MYRSKPTLARHREKFSTQTDPAVLAEMRRIANSKGRQLQAIIEETFRDFIEKHKTAKPSPHVMAHFQASMEKNRELGRLLAQ